MGFRLRVHPPTHAVRWKAHKSRPWWFGEKASKLPIPNGFVGHSHTSSLFSTLPHTTNLSSIVTKKKKSISSPLLHSLTIILEITFHTKTQRATTRKKKAHWASPESVRQSKTHFVTTTDNKSQLTLQLALEVYDDFRATDEHLNLICITFLIQLVGVC